MQTFISKFGLAAHLAILSVAPLFLSPFCEGDTIALSLLWLSCGALVWLLMEPSRRADEHLHDARVRVRKAIVRDPLTWIFALLLIYVSLRSMNGGIEKFYDGAAKAWVLDGPSVGLLPGHVDGHAFLPFSTAVALFVVLQGCRHALGKAARISLVAMIAVLTGVAAIVFTIACRMGHEGACLLSGAYRGLDADGALTWIWKFDLQHSMSFFTSSLANGFGLALLSSIVATAGMFECKWNRHLLLFSFAIGASATGLLFFAPPFILLAYLAAAVVLLLLSCGYLALCFRTAILLRYLAAVLIASVVPLLMVICVAPAGLTEAHTAVFAGEKPLSAVMFPVGFWELRALLSDHALKFWNSNLWLGVGLGAYEPSLWLAGAASSCPAASIPINSWLMLLAERGLLGAIALVLPVIAMIFSLVLRILGALGRHAFLPLCALGLVAALTTAIVAFLDCSLLNASTLLPAAAFFALAASTFPVRKKAKPAEDRET